MDRLPDALQAAIATYVVLRVARDRERAAGTKGVRASAPGAAAAGPAASQTSPSDGSSPGSGPAVRACLGGAPAGGGAAPPHAGPVVDAGRGGPTGPPAANGGQAATGGDRSGRPAPDAGAPPVGRRTSMPPPAPPAAGERVVGPHGRDVDCAMPDASVAPSTPTHPGRGPGAGARMPFSPIAQPVFSRSRPSRSPWPPTGRRPLQRASLKFLLCIHHPELLFISCSDAPPQFCCSAALPALCR